MVGASGLLGVWRYFSTGFVAMQHITPWNLSDLVDRHRIAIIINELTGRPMITMARCYTAETELPGRISRPRSDSRNSRMTCSFHARTHDQAKARAVRARPIPSAPDSR